MDKTIPIIDQQQLIHKTTSLSESNISTMQETIIDKHCNGIQKSTSLTDIIKHRTFKLWLLTSPVRGLKSIHIPHFSDRCLRTAFLLFITFIAITSFTVALIIGSTTVHFQHQCLFYASFKYELLQTIQSELTIKILPLSDKFSSQSTCDFYTFCNVFTFIYCVMTGFFFVLFNGDNRVITTNDRCLILPWFPISLILGFFSLINACMITNGFLKFCSTVTSNHHLINSCAQLNQLHFELYPNASSLFTYMLIAIIESWLQLALFVGVIAILTIRLNSIFDSSNHHHKYINEDSNGIMMQSC